MENSDKNDIAMNLINLEQDATINHNSAASVNVNNTLNQAQSPTQAVPVQGTGSTNNEIDAEQISLLPQPVKNSALGKKYNVTVEEVNNSRQDSQLENPITKGVESNLSSKIRVRKVDSNVNVPLPKLAENEESPNYPMPLYKDDYSMMVSISGYLRANTFVTDVNSKHKLNGWLGVYLPTIQHIFGVIMFLRLYWIVGCMGFIAAFFMVFLCCVCTFLTSISMSAIATNGKVESGGSYFMISRNLGPQFGSAVGLLFYMANAVATSMYLVGTVEILLTYVAPDLPQFHDPQGVHGTAMYNNNRIYTTILLFVVFCIVALGVKFVQVFAPITLACVIVSIICVIIGGFYRSPTRSPQVCYLGNRLLKKSFYTIDGSVNCSKVAFINKYCDMNVTSLCDDYLMENDVTLKAAMPGFASGVIKDNIWTSYMKEKETSPNVKGVVDRDITQDMLTTFFLLLAIYFPSVTGIMTGSNMSGDLRNPQKDIPRFTIAAQLTTSIVYLIFVVVFAGTIRREVLWDKFGQSLGGGMVVAELCWPHRWVLLVGSLTSTFGAGLQCLCSAPRLLHSIAKDDVIPFLSVFVPVTRFNEPFRALVISYFFAECAVLLGNVDLIAPIVDFFFLMCYAFVNMACALQDLLNTPNWRPRFKFYHWSLSLIGAGLCLFIMFSTYWYYALVTIGMCAIIYKYVEYRGAEKEWGDGIRGLKLAGAKYSLLNIEEETHTKNWRPQILILCKANEDEKIKYPKLLTFARQLKGSRGLLIITTLVQGDYADKEVREKANRIKNNLKEYIKEMKMRAFVQTIVCSEIREGISTMIQSIGLGALKPNTVMVGWPYTWRTLYADTSYYHDFLDAIHRVATAEICLMIPKGINDFPDDHGIKRVIDVWWIMNDGGLLMILPVLLKRHKCWQHSQLRVFAVASQFDNSIKMKESLVKWLYDLRIPAEVVIVEMPSNDVISAYLYEKTMALEERVKIIEQLKLTSKDIEQEPQALLDQMRRNSILQLDLKGKRDVGSNESKIHQFTFSPSALAQLKSAMEMSTNTSIKADNNEDDLKRMHNAVELNMMIRDKSSTSDLIIVNLPGPPSNPQALNNYINYLDVLSDGLPRILLVRGTGKEVITIYS